MQFFFFCFFVIEILQIELADDAGVERIPETWGNDPNGRATNNPKTILSGGGLQPLGGHEATGTKFYSDS